MSYGVPFVFTCINFEGCTYVDGGMADNYPIELYQDQADTTFGVQLVTNHSRVDLNTFQKYTNAIITCLKIQLQDKAESSTTLNVDADIMSSMNFDLSSEDKKDLFHIGYSSCTRFFDALD